MKQHTDAAGLLSAYTWDARGRLLSRSVHAPGGPLTTAYQYDSAGRWTGWRNNRGQQGSYTLDAAARITREEITDARGIAWQRTLRRAGNGRVQSQSLGADQRSSYSHNANGDLSAQTNGLGQRWQLTRDGLRRTSAWQNPLGHSAQVSFNGLGAITQASDFKGVATRYVPDARGQARQEASADIGQQNTSYDARGLPTHHKDGAGRVQNRQYDALGRISQIQWQDSSSANTQTAQFSYSAGGQLSRIQQQGQHSHHIAWQRDAAGRVIRKEQSIEGQHPSAYRLVLDYVPAGQGGAGHVAQVSYPSGKALQYRYDSSGLITDTVYGEEAMAPGLQSFALGHYGRRQTAGGASASLSPAGVSEYIYIPTAQGPMPIAAEIDGRLHAVHTDQLNTPRQLTDANGNKVWQWAISGFGEVEATTAQTGWIRERNGSAGQRSNTLPVTFSLRFPGQQFDEESGLHYNHHRYYDPYLTVGYTEADPIGLNGGWNRFAYAENDPLGAVDPEGLRASRGDASIYPPTTNCSCMKNCKQDVFLATSHALTCEKVMPDIPKRNPTIFILEILYKDACQNLLTTTHCTSSCVRFCAGIQPESPYSSK